MLRPSIEAVKNLPDFATVYQWYLQFPKKPTAVTITDDDINVRCVSAELPKLTGAAIEVQIRGHKVKQPGIHNYSGQITLTMIETVDNMISEFIRQWREAIWQTKTGVQGLRADVEAEIMLIRLNRQDTPIWEYKLFGCLLEDYDPSGGAMAEQGDILKPTLTIGYDWFEDRKI